MNRTVTRADLIAVLTRWQDGSLSASEVHAWAEARYLPGDNYVDDEEDSGSAANEVLARLDMLDINLITREDIPHYLELLHTPKGALAEGLQRFEAHQTTIDFRARADALSTTEPYARALASAPPKSEATRDVEDPESPAVDRRIRAKFPSSGPINDSRARDIQKAIGAVLLRDWDPIGVKDVPEAQDEYDLCVGGVYRLLASGATVEEIAAHLGRIEDEWMGTGKMGVESWPGSRATVAAARLKALDVRLGEP